MNTGVISSRYAKALLMLVDKTGGGERAFDQARALLSGAEEGTPQWAPLSGGLCPEISSLVLLMRRKGRSEHLRLTLTHFVRLWCEENDVHLVHLRSAVPSEELEKRVESAVASRFGGKVIMDSRTDPDLIGGFVYDVDDYMLDASVRTQLERIRRQLTSNTERLV